MIWKRTIASQMADAELEKTTATIAIANSSEKFIAAGEVVKFDGFLHVYRESHDDENDQDDESHLLPPMQKGQSLDSKEVVATERFTQHPARYTEASLVRKLEELGIGRPSTYAPTISTIQQREYVEKGDREGKERTYQQIVLKSGVINDMEKIETVGAEKSKLFPTDIGMVVNGFLTEYFPGILDFNFTAKIEKEFDEVADGEKEWPKIIGHFYKDFHPSVESTLAVKTDHRVGERQLGIDPQSNKPISVKIGRFGPVVQIGTAEDEEKPRFAQMKKGQSMETISLEEALELFKLPRTLGDFEGKTVVVATGRFGPYIRHDSKFVSLPKDVDPMEIALEEAVDLISAKRKADIEKIVKLFDEDPEVQILNGRFGVYIAYKKTNYKIPKDVVAQDLNLETCYEIIRLQDEKPAGAKKGRYAKRK